MSKPIKMKNKYLKGSYEDREIISLINSAFFNNIKGFKVGLFLGTGKYVQSILKEKDLTKQEITQICKDCLYPDVHLALKIIELRPDYAYHVAMIEKDPNLGIDEQQSDLIKKLKNKKKLLDMMSPKND